MKKIVLFILIISIQYPIFAQNKKLTTLDTAKHNPKIAAYLSLALPGAGQVYNKKFWKVPIVYAGLGATAKLYSNLNQLYWIYIHDIIAVKNGLPTITQYTDLNVLKTQKDQVRYYRDMSAFLFLFVWSLNVIDAYVDAMFYNFDVSPDLSFNPGTIYDYSSQEWVPAVKISVNF